MLLKQIILANFRNFEQKKFAFNPFLTIVLGENARGKTNLLEAIYFIGHAEGFRESKEEELMTINTNSSKVEAKFQVGDEQIDLHIWLIKQAAEIKKKFSLNKTQKQFQAYIKETIKAILFSPQEIEMMTGAPEKRRRYFDSVISYYDLEYKKRLINYENALRKRNKLLEKYTDERSLKEELFFWGSYLEEQASYISEKRSNYMNFLNSHQEINDKKFYIDYLKNELTQKKLEEMFEIEKRYRRTLIGPQKDDFQIYLQMSGFKKNLHHFGSRSEQRLAIFWLVMLETLYYEEKIGKKPIILLDDIFSELDVKNKKLILDFVKKYQTVATTTEIETLKLIDIPHSIITL